MVDDKLKPEENQKTDPKFINKKNIWVLALVLVASLILAGFSYAQKEVHLVLDGNKVLTKTFAGTVGDFINQEKIKLNPNDRVIPEPNTLVKDGIQIVICRAVPVTISVDGQKTELLSSAQTVKELIEEQKIKLNKLDQVVPGLNEKIKSGMEIEIARIEQKEEEKEVSVAFATIKKSNPNLSRGMTKEVRTGKNGLEKQVWQVTYKNGKEIERQLLERKIISQPVDRIVQVGTQQVASRGGENFRYSKAMYMVASAYTYTGNNTASGAAPHVGVVAVDPGVISMGTRLYIEGYGYATALDKGSAIKGNRIDLFLESEQQCRNWGVRKVKVYILE